MVSKTVLQEAVDEAIDRRLEANHKIATDSPYGPLLGYCFSNSIVLQAVLEERGIEARIVGGARAYDLPEDGADVEFHPETAEELSEGVPLHYWVEVSDGDETYVLELATETRPTRGPPAIHTGLPDDLVRYPDSYEYAGRVKDEDLAEAAICPYCGDNPEYDVLADAEKACSCGREYSVAG